MTQIGDFNPFRPGRGITPPYLAGRENEQRQLKQILAEISAGRSPAADMVMYGPRGMGKTVLLNWLKNEAKKSGTVDNPIRTSSATPNQLKDPAEMWSFLLSDDWLKKDTPNKTLLKDLISECKKNPLVFLLDEAHKMEPEQCLALLNLSQQVQNEAPFLLVLAGTPGLAHFLSTVGASFVERSNKIGIGRLDAQATADAIVKPLNEHGIEIDDNSLVHVVEDSQHYPYFIQLWGAALWNEANKENLTHLTDEQVDIAESNVNGEKQSFYAERWSRLFQDKLLPVAQIIATAFQNTSKYTEIALVLLLRDALPADQAEDQHIASVLQALTQQDFIWRPPGTDLYEAGIPSLMTYVLDQ